MHTVNEFLGTDGVEQRDLFRWESTCKGSEAWEIQSEQVGVGLSEEEYFNNYELRSGV